MVSVGGLGGFLQGLTQGMQWKREQQLRRDELDMRRTALDNESKRLQAHLDKLERDEDRARDEDQRNSLEVEGQRMAFRRKQIIEERERWAKSLNTLKGLPMVGDQTQIAIQNIKNLDEELESLDAEYDDTLSQLAQTYREDQQLSEAADEGIAANLAAVSKSAAKGAMNEGAAGGATPPSNQQPVTRDTTDGTQPSSAPSSSQDVTPEGTAATGIEGAQRMLGETMKLVDGYLQKPDELLPQGIDGVPGASVELTDEGWTLVIDPAMVTESLNQSTGQTGSLSGTGSRMGTSTRESTTQKPNTEEIAASAMEKMVVNLQRKLRGAGVDPQLIAAAEEQMRESLGSISVQTLEERGQRAERLRQKGELRLVDMANTVNLQAQGRGSNVPGMNEQQGLLKEVEGVQLVGLWRASDGSVMEVEAGQEDRITGLMENREFLGYSPRFDDDITPETIRDVLNWFDLQQQGEGLGEIPRELRLEFVSDYAPPLYAALVKMGALKTNAPVNSTQARTSNFSVVDPTTIHDFVRKVENSKANLGESVVNSKAPQAGLMQFSTSTPAQDADDFVGALATEGVKGTVDDRIIRDFSNRMISFIQYDPTYLQEMGKERAVSILRTLEDSNIADITVNRRGEGPITDPRALRLRSTPPPEITRREWAEVAALKRYLTKFIAGEGIPTAPGPAPKSPRIDKATDRFLKSLPGGR